eukprot:331186-Rhodomonas_salina.1
MRHKRADTGLRSLFGGTPQPRGCTVATQSRGCTEIEHTQHCGDDNSNAIGQTQPDRAVQGEGVGCDTVEHPRSWRMQQNAPRWRMQQRAAAKGRGWDLE